MIIQTIKSVLGFVAISLIWLLILFLAFNPAYGIEESELSEKEFIRQYNALQCVKNICLRKPMKACLKDCKNYKGCTCKELTNGKKK